MERISTKNRILSSAVELFYREGVGATGIDTIAVHAGVAKMSIYNHFESKSDLVNASIQRRIEKWRDLYRTRLLRASTPQERVLAVFDSYLDHAALVDEWGFRGCGLLNAAAELPVGDAGRTSVLRQKEEAEKLLTDHLREMKPSAGRSLKEVAEHLSFLLEGAVSRAGLDGNNARLKRARSIAVSILENL